MINSVFRTSLLLLIFTTLSCAKMNAVNVDAENLFFEFNTELKIDPACLSKAKYQACLFFKNPVHQSGKEFPEKISPSTNLSELHTTGVEVITKEGSDFLENINIEVFAAKGKRAKKVKGQWKFTYNDEKDLFEQVFAYFWASYASAIIEERTGRYWGKGKQIKIFTNDTYSGYSPSTNSIHLQSSDSNGALAINAGLITHYLGLANLYHASNGQIENLSSDADHKDCKKSDQQNRRNYCCKSALGCSRAISSGVADYFSAVMFPQAPTIGESWSNSSDGISTCGQTRDLRKLSEVTSQQAFSNCSGGLKGHSVNLGSIYASIWWEIRKQAKKDHKNGDVEVDTLYQNHLIKIEGNDNFKTVYQKILLADREIFSGKFANYFKSEFEKRGIPVE